MADWEASGESSEEFARGRGYAGVDLRRWKHRLAHEPEVRLARVEVVPAVQVGPETPVVVRVGSVQLELRRGFVAETLEAVLEVLEGRQR